MRNALSPLAFIAFTVLNASAMGAEHPELKAFPPAKEGMERFVIVLQQKERGAEENFQVEIIVGKEMLADGVNRVRLGNTIEPRSLPGWGHIYYEVTGSSATMSTMMAPPPGAPMEMTFVTGTPLFVRYDNRFPIVVYAPTGYEVRYRIWQAPEATEKAEKG